MKIRISSIKSVWLAGAFLIFIVIGGLKFIGLQNFSNSPPPTRISGEVRLMSLAGFTARPVVVRKKINTEPPTQPAMPATAFTFVVTKKIVPPSSGSSEETASSTSQPPVPTTDGMVSANTASLKSGAVDTTLPPAGSSSFTDRWQPSVLISTLLDEGDAHRSFSSASAPPSDVASPPADPPRKIAFVSVVLDRNAVFPEIMPTLNRTTAAGSPSTNRPQERKTPPPTLAPESGAISKRTPALPYSLQLSSCRSLKNAQNAAADYRKIGLDPFIVNVYLKNHGGSWWRVFSGQYVSVEAALQSKRALKLSGAVVKRTRFANLIGEYETQDLTIEMKNRLETLGFSAYSVESPNRGFRLFVGAFTRKRQAEKQALDLRTKGMMCRVVNR